MARYTLNTSEICEQVSGLKFNELTGMSFDRIDDIANAAIPHIFSSRYKLLDDGDDRIDLERMILEHYWEYEVCTYTPSDFILRLNRRLNEIAPLYNQRYESIKLDYPIFDDVKYKEDGTDAHEDHGVTSAEGNTKHSDQDVVTNKHTGTIKVDSQEDGTTTVNVDRTEQDKGHDITVAGKAMSNTGTETSDRKTTDWDYKNDTPQGSISGIRDTDYLTGYSKHTTEKEQGKFNYTGTLNGTYFDGTSYNMSSDDTKMQGADHLESTLDAHMTDQKTKTSGTTDTDETATTLHGKGVEQTTTFNNTDEATTKYGHNIATKDSGKDDRTHAGNYHKEVEGKSNSGKSYMQMLQEYRDVMINIYMEIIEELKDLFFIIY